MKKVPVSLLLLLLSFGLVFCDNTSKADDKQDKDKKKKAKKEERAADVKITNKWDLPAVLKEVSGIAYLGPNRFACVQDEAGIVFIYNTATKTIEEEVDFAGAGDYEGIAVAGKAAYVVRSDGNIFEIPDLLGNNSLPVKTYATALTAKQNVEGLCYDKKHNRLLLAIKGSEPNNPGYKGIYAFDLQSKKLNPNPVYKINLRDPAFAEVKAKKENTIIQPSEINIHPRTGDIYVTEATKPKLLIMDSSGKIKRLLHLSSGDFAQPEGLAFSPEGDLFISNEGKKEPGNILQVQIPQP
ncbi:SdiA-regulated domain-containing protein [Adhaeribacter swui]|uniref:SdiA-regulated domain-containing protein n=1 Tax=Adhaeribacter swui TaxID=2086471 RepID=A0A7G7G322_9BACT|nr:SdiA-regulated domain-containing protein [Adhaeribacter swui]QNF31556.1 SdiA-regulated domain-containing protein [Adhaeribacter swui]